MSRICYTHNWLLLSTPFIMQFCRACSHVYDEREFGGGVLVFQDCPFCGSSNTGPAAEGIITRRHLTDPTVEQPDSAQQSQYAIGYRLAKGFSILNGGDL